MNPAGARRNPINYDGMRRTSFGDSPLGQRATAEQPQRNVVGRAAVSISHAATMVASSARSLATRALHAATPPGMFTHGKFRESLKRTSQHIGLLLGALVEAQGKPEPANKWREALRALEALPALMAPMVARGADAQQIFQARAEHHLMNLTAVQLLALRAELSRDKEPASGGGAGFLEVLARCATAELEARLALSSPKWIVSEMGEVHSQDVPADEDVKPKVIDWLDQQVKNGALDDSQAVQFLMQKWTPPYLAGLAGNSAMKDAGSDVPALALSCLPFLRARMAAKVTTLADELRTELQGEDSLDFVHGVEFAPFGQSENALVSRVTYLAELLSEYDATTVPGDRAQPREQVLSVQMEQLRAAVVTTLARTGFPFLEDDKPRVFTQALDKLGVTEPERRFALQVSKGDWATAAQKLYESRDAIDPMRAKTLLDVCLNPLGLSAALRTALRTALTSSEFEYRFRVAQGLVDEGGLQHPQLAAAELVNAFRGSALGSSLLHQLPAEWYRSHAIDGSVLHPDAPMKATSLPDKPAPQSSVDDVD